MDDAAKNKMNIIRQVANVPSQPDGKFRKTVYRIVKFEHLVRLFQDREYSLVSPFTWEDPFEKLWSRLVFANKSEHDQVVQRVFGSCFTFEARSDAMWNIYSRNWLGVRITMRVDELERQIRLSPQFSSGRFWLGEVSYLTDSKLTQKAIALKEAVGLAGADTSEAMAMAWLNKRIAFRHENEMRLLFVLNEDRTTGSSGPTYKVSVDPHALVTSVHIDPRAPSELVDTLTRDIRTNLHFKGSIRQSSLHRLPSALESMLAK